MVEGQTETRVLHSELGMRYAELKSWEAAADHYLKAQEWAEATRLLINHKDELLESSAPFMKHSLEKISPEYFHADLRLVHLQVDTLAHLGEFQRCHRHLQRYPVTEGAGGNSRV